MHTHKHEVPKIFRRSMLLVPFLLSDPAIRLWHLNNLFGLSRATSSLHSSVVQLNQGMKLSHLTCAQAVCLLLKIYVNWLYLSLLLVYQCVQEVRILLIS